MIDIDQVEQAFLDKAKALNLDPQKKEIVKYQTEDNSWVFVVTRQGYRKAVAEQPDYLRHIIYPIYDDTSIIVDNNNVRVEMSGKMVNLMGAVGFLYKRDMDGFFMYHVALTDFEHLSKDSVFWQTMPHTAISKSCEIALIRIAYPELFGNVYSEEEIAEKKSGTRKDILAFLRDNHDITEKHMKPNVKMENLSNDELRSLEAIVLKETK